MTNRKPDGMLRKNRFWLLGLSLLIILLDQLTKHIVRRNLSLYEVKGFMPYWNWTLAYNQGAAFSFLADKGSWPKVFFGVIAVLVSIGLVYYILNRAYSCLTGFGLSLILGGAVGNLIDRIVEGRVTDFVDWHYGTHHFAAFNLADSAISVGVALLIIESLFFSQKTD